MRFSSLSSVLRAIVTAVITASPWKKEASVPSTSQSEVKNRADTKGDQAPAVAGAKGDVVISYGEEKG